MHDLLAKFFETPNATHFLAVQAALRREYNLQTFTLELAEVAELLADGQFSQMRNRIARMMPAAALSPRVHAWGAVAAVELGDHNDAEIERFQYDCCLQGLNATGDGTQRHPYRGTYASDARDLLEWSGLLIRRQELQEIEDRRYDVFTCKDQRTVWFDVTPLVVGQPQLIAARLMPVGTTSTPRTRTIRTAPKKAATGVSRSKPSRAPRSRRTKA